jgi:DNA-binding MarR family transcriptional regulator
MERRSLPDVVHMTMPLEGEASGPVSSEISTQLARLRVLAVDAARGGALASPLVELHRPRGLRPQHVEALWWLRTEGLLSVNELTRRLGTSVSKTTRILDRLEEKELVWRDRSEDDRRVVRVHLSEGGRAMAEQADHAIAQRLSSLLQPLMPDEREDLLELLERILHAALRPRQ